MGMKEHWDNIIADGEHFISDLPESVRGELRDVKIGDSIRSNGRQQFISGVWFQPTAHYTITKISEDHVTVEGYTHATRFGGDNE
jgi:hypothetical protein